MFIQSPELPPQEVYEPRSQSSPLDWYKWKSDIGGVFRRLNPLLWLPTNQPHRYFPQTSALGRLQHKDKWVHDDPSLLERLVCGCHVGPSSQKQKMPRNLQRQDDVHLRHEVSVQQAANNSLQSIPTPRLQRHSNSCSASNLCDWQPRQDCSSLGIGFWGQEECIFQRPDQPGICGRQIELESLQRRAE